MKFEVNRAYGLLWVNVITAFLNFQQNCTNNKKCTKWIKSSLLFSIKAFKCNNFGRGFLGKTYIF